MATSRFFVRRAAAPVACLLLVAAITVCSAPAASARNVGFIMPLCCDFGDTTRDRFTGFLGQSGFGPGTVEILVQRPAADRVSILNSIRKLIAYNVDALVVFGGSAAREAMQETQSIPIIFIGAYDPLREGLVQSLDLPGKNISGVSCKTSLPFLLDNIQETAGLSAFGVIYHADNLDSRAQHEELKDLTGKRGVKIVSADVRSVPVDSLPGLLASTQFVYVAAGCYSNIVSGADLQRIARPVATQCQNSDDMGAVLSLAADNDEVLQRAADITARTLKGETAAQRLGLKIPFSVLSRATKLIK
jgi:putative ABC transport system substrate-binding protein